MLYYAAKVGLSALIIVLVSEISKFNATIGGLIKSLPLVSLLAILWIYIETKNTETIADLSVSTFWFVLPTLPMFLLFPYLLRQKVDFYWSLGLSIAFMLVCYVVTIAILRRFGFPI